MFCLAINFGVWYYLKYKNNENYKVFLMVLESSVPSVVLFLLGVRFCKDICLCGNGKNDSPGHSACYCVYTLMEHATKVVLDLEVLDKRECRV